MIIFNRNWVERKLDGLWEEMVGIYRTFPDKFDTSTRHAKPAQTLPDMTYEHRWIPRSELSAARLLQVVLENRITHIGSDTGGAWYFYNEVFHKEVDDGIVVGDMVVECFADQMRWAMDQVSRDIDAYAQQSATPQNTVAQITKRERARFREHYAFQDRLHSEAGLNALRSRFRKQCARGVSYFEEDRRWLVCQNGVIDLEGFRRRPIVSENFRQLSPDFAVNRAVDCNFNPQAKSPHWDNFLETSIPDPEIRAFLQRLVGAAFLAESKVKAIPNLQGPKDCGKTVFVDTLEKLAGGYGVQPSPDALMQKEGGGQNFEQDTLRGGRFIAISEPSMKKRLDDTFCKQVTGGDEVRTRTLNKASTPWLPQGVIFIASNHVVNFNTSDAAFVERLCLVHFPHRFYDPAELPEGDWHIKDRDLEANLKSEFEGIFLWVIMGMWQYLVHGIGKPDSVKIAGDKFAVESSSVLTWVREQIEEGRLRVTETVADEPQSHYALTGKLYDAYDMWAMSNNETKLKKRWFRDDLTRVYGDELNSGGRRIPRLVGTGQWANFHANDVASDIANGF